MYNDIPSIMTFNECKDILKVGKNTLLDLLHSNTIQGFKIGNRWKIPKESVVEFIRYAQKKPESFMNLYFETFTKHHPNTFKTLINLFTSYTYEYRYPHLLLAIDLIKKDHSLHDIINTVYHLR